MFSLTWKISNGSHSFCFSFLLSVATLSPSRKAAGGPFFFLPTDSPAVINHARVGEKKRRRI
jgi:hypothetical protein